MMVCSLVVCWALARNGVMGFRGALHTGPDFDDDSTEWACYNAR